MSVYVELVIFNNFFVDTMLELAVLTVRRRRIRPLRILLSSAIGCAAGTAYAIMPEWAQIIVKVLLAPLMCVIFTSPQGKSPLYKIGDYIGTTVIFVLFTYFAGGAIFGLSYALGVDLKSYAALGLGAMGTCALILAARLIARKRSAGTRATAKSTISASGHTVSADGLLDSGNLLVDCESGLPVVILSKEVEERLSPPNIKGFIQIGTACGEDSLTLVDIDEVTVDGKSYKALGALSKRSFDGFDVILQNSMF